MTRAIEIVTAAAVTMSLMCAASPALAQTPPAVPPICNQPGVPDAIRTLLQFCPSGHCMPRVGMGDLLERRVDPRILERISADPLLYPVRIFYRRSHDRFAATDLISADHYQHAVADLREIALQYSRFPGSKIVILGRASQTGSAARNIVLSQGRARRVADYLEREYHIPADDLHRAYFGSQLFQVHPNELQDLGVTVGDLEREGDSPTNLEAAVNQSVVAFVFPCPESRQPTQPVQPVAEETGCPLDADAGAFRPAAPVSGCRSRLGSDAGVPSHIYLIGGSASELFSRYIQVLGRNHGGRDLRNLTVHYAVNGGDGGLNWQQKSNVCSWFTQDLVAAWTDALSNVQAAEAPLPADIGNADVYCAAHPPEPLSGGTGGCGCSCRVSRFPSRGTLGLISLLVLALRSRRPGRRWRSSTD